MAGQRQPIDLVVARGKKHLTKSEIEERKNTEVHPCTDEINAPSFLTAKQKRSFSKICGQLTKLKIMGETDCETLARYVVAEELYEKTTKKLRSALDSIDDPFAGDALGVEQLAKLQDRFFKQAQMAARDLGLTISARCRLVVPEKTEDVKVNKFARFSSSSDFSDEEKSDA